MIAMLVVMFMIMARAKDPNTWRWLAGDPAQPADVDAAPAVSDESGPPSLSLYRQANQAAAPAPPGPTDRDPEEADAAREEFQAITDGTTTLQPEEMPAYWRLFRWANNQSLAELRQRARRDLYFTDLAQLPDKHRGELLQLRLHLRRVRHYPADDNPAGVRDVYEAWGPSPESQVWLYEVLFSDLPPGMPSGPDVVEEATFYGYFLKLQGYFEAGAPPRAAPLRAPLLIGRLVWHPTDLPVAQGSAWFWPTVCAGALVLLAIVVHWLLSFASPPRAVGTPNGASEAPIEGWLEQAQADPADAEPSWESGDGGDEAPPHNGFDDTREPDR